MTPERFGECDSSTLNTSNSHRTHCMMVKVKNKQVNPNAHYSGGSLPSKPETSTN